MPYTDRKKQRDYQRRWVADRKYLFFKDKVCTKCGSNIALELDHIDRDEKVSHSIWSWSEERRNLELVKCQILCRDCHYNKSASEIRQINHGTDKMYSTMHCRCPQCRAYNRKKSRGRL